MVRLVKNNIFKGEAMAQYALQLHNIHMYQNKWVTSFMKFKMIQINNKQVNILNWVIFWSHLIFIWRNNI